MKIQLINNKGESAILIDGHAVSGIEAVQIEALMDHRTGVHFIVHSAELELHLAGEDVDLLITNSMEDTAAYIRSLDPKILENRALQQLGSMDGGFASLAEAMLHLIADDLTETDDEATAGQAGDPYEWPDAGRGLVDPLAGGFGN